MHDSVIFIIAGKKEEKKKHMDIFFHFIFTVYNV